LPFYRYGKGLVITHKEISFGNLNKTTSGNFESLVLSKTIKFSIFFVITPTLFHFAE
jgi:hypothetical protein